MNPRPEIVTESDTNPPDRSVVAPAPVAAPAAPAPAPAAAGVQEVS